MGDANPYLGNADDVEAPRQLNDVDLEGTRPQASDLAQGQPGFEDGPRYKDQMFAIAFGFHIFAVFLILIVTNAVNDSDSADTSLSTDEMSNTYPQVLVAMVLGSLFSCCWVQLMKRFARMVIQCVIYTGCAMMFLFCIMGFAATNYFVGVLFLFMFLLSAWYAYSVRSKIRFAGELLHEACSIISDSMPETLHVAYFMILLKLIWLLFWAGAVYGCIKSNDTAWVTFFLVLSFFWTTEVCKNVVHITTSRRMHAWYFSMGEADGSIVSKGEVDAEGNDVNPVRQALTRALTTSFGSVCYGSLLVSVVEFFHFITYQLRRLVLDTNIRFLVGCVDFFLSCLGSCSEIFNKYAFVAVATHNCSFRDGAEKTSKLFKDNFVLTLVNDDLVAGVLFFGMIIVGCITGLIVGIWSWSASDGNHGMFVGFIGLLIGHGIAHICLAPIDSSVAALYVLYAEDPEKLYGEYEEWPFRKLYIGLSERHMELAKMDAGVSDIPAKFQRGGGGDVRPAGDVPKSPPSQKAPRQGGVQSPPPVGEAPAPAQGQGGGDLTV